jgi:hypothetical protein
VRPDAVVQKGLRSPQDRVSVTALPLSSVVWSSSRDSCGDRKAGWRGLPVRSSRFGSEHWLEIPAWMFDRSACAKVRLAADPRADLSSLVALGLLLRDVLHNRPAGSNVSDSTVSSLSHDPNRADAHATPGQAEAGAPPRAASNRFVGRRTTDDRPDADLVRAADRDTGGSHRPRYAACDRWSFRGLSIPSSR